MEYPKSMVMKAGKEKRSAMYTDWIQGIVCDFTNDK